MTQIRFIRKQYLIFVFLIAVLFGCQMTGAESPRVCFNDHCFDVELAVSETERTRGLQERERLDENRGMLFVFSESYPHRFWMKDTLIPLDMIWLDAARRVVHVEANVPPCVEEVCPTYGPEEAARYVLEVNAGIAARSQIQTGTTAEFFAVE